MSGIEWTQETWNPVAGCSRASAGCDNCYAVTMTHRLGAMAEADIANGRDPGAKKKYIGLTVLNNRGDRHFNGKVVCDEEPGGALTIPLRWKKPRTVFVNSMSDLFHREVPFGFIDRVFAVMALTPQHTYQILTKRPERMAEYFDGKDASPSDRRLDVANAAHNGTPWKGSHQGWTPVHGRPGFYLPPWPLPNVWLGTSCEDQPAADARIPHLLRCPVGGAAVRFLSCEPLIGGVDLRSVADDGHNSINALTGNRIEEGGVRERHGVDWVICGGESGPGARACDIAWIRSIVEQCRGSGAGGVPVFVKQLGSRPGYPYGEGVRILDRLPAPIAEALRDDGDGWYCWELKDRKGGDMGEWPEDLRVREMPGVVGVER